MADTLIALIRGINVGRANRVAMADLRALLSDLGYEHVRTLLNSGNAVLSGPAGAGKDAADRIEAALRERLGVRVRVVVVGASELSAAIVENPLVAEAADDPSHLLVAFLADRADRARLVRLAEQDWAPEAIAVGERAAYVWCPGGVADSRLSRALGQALGDGVTARNWATVLKLDAIAQAVS